MTSTPISSTISSTSRVAPDLVAQKQAAPFVRVGFLRKKSPSFFQGWQQRWFVLEKSSFSMRYYKTRDDKEPAGEVPLSEILIANFDMLVVVDSKNPKRFVIKTRKRTYELEGENARDTASWVDDLRQCLS